VGQLFISRAFTSSGNQRDLASHVDRYGNIAITTSLEPDMHSVLASLCKGCKIVRAGFSIREEGDWAMTCSTQTHGVAQEINDIQDHVGSQLSVLFVE